MRTILTPVLAHSTWRLFLRRLIGWQKAGRGLSLRAMAAAAGMGVPLAAGYLTNRFPLGLGIALGCLSIQTPFPARCAKDAFLKARAQVLPAALAAIIALLGALVHVAADWIFLGTAVLASLSMRYSRPLAVAATRFMIFVFIFGNALLQSPIPLGLFALICLGIAWMTYVGLIASAFQGPGEINNDAQGSTGAAARVRRMRRELAILSTWDYPARLTLGITFTLILKILYPAHHFYWASLTVLLCTPRQFEAWPMRAIQRALGTLIGVVAAQLLLLAAPGCTTLLITLVVLSFARRWFDERSYLLYSAVMAPLILFLMGPQHMVASSAASDRLLATSVGVLIVFMANLCAARTTARALPRNDLKHQIRVADERF